jgi:hypothetical protein
LSPASFAVSDTCIDMAGCSGCDKSDRKS